MSTEAGFRARVQSCDPPEGEHADEKSRTDMKTKTPASKAIAAAQKSTAKKSRAKETSLPPQRTASKRVSPKKTVIKTAVKKSVVRKPGPPPGADRYRFQLQAGEGEVVMQARAGGAKGVFIPLHPDFQAEVREATGGRFYTPAIAALAQWALGELRRRKKKLVISDAGQT